MDEALIGTWLLKSHQVEDRRTGGRSDPFGATPAGVLIILADGRMSALITPDPAGAGTTGPAPIVAYSGHYRLPEAGLIVTAVDVASIAPWVGTDQERNYVVTGDRLELKTPQAGSGDMAAMVATMVWERETSAVASGGASD